MFVQVRTIEILKRAAAGGQITSGRGVTKTDYIWERRHKGAFKAGTKKQNETKKM